jgi:hypothetical protein
MSGDYGFAGEKSGRGLTNNIHSHCTPRIDLDGGIEVRVKRALNMPGAFRGRVIKAESIGQSSDDLAHRAVHERSVLRQRGEAIDVHAER